MKYDQVNVLAMIYYVQSNDLDISQHIDLMFKHFVAILPLFQSKFFSLRLLQNHKMLNQ